MELVSFGVLDDRLSEILAGLWSDRERDKLHSML